MPQKLQLVPTKAEEYRSRQSFVIRISQKLVVRIQVMDMLTMVMNNLLPMHLFEAAQRFEEMEKKMLNMAKDGKSAMEVGKTINREDLEETMKFLKHYASVVVLEPKIVLKDPTEGQLCADSLDADELMGIFYARAPQDEEEGQDNSPLISREEAQEFRGPTPDAATPAGPAGETVRTAPELLDRGDREVIHA